MCEIGEMDQSLDPKHSLFISAQQGNLSRLQALVGKLNSPSEVSKLVSAKIHGTTPLVAACRHGHYDVAEFLIKTCNADIEQGGSAVFDGETVECAPPLWCAAAAGHLNLVQMLLQLGANVNSTTRTNSTPLRAACFDGNFEVVQTLILYNADIEIANHHGHTPLMIACFKGHEKIARYLMRLGANVARRSAKGNTALHDCAESGSLSILKYLLKQGATMDVDSYGMTPLMAASVTGHAHIVQYLIDKPHMVSKKERIDALELLGATYVDKKRDVVGAQKFWARALAERYMSDPRIPKAEQKITVPAYDNTREFTTLEELEELVSDLDGMRMQALVIRERILGPAHPDTSFYVRHRGADYADLQRFDRCLALWHYALDMQQSMLEPLNSMTQSSFFSFAELFSFWMGEEKPRCPISPVCFEDLITVFDKILREVVEGRRLNDELPMTERASLHRILVIALHLACLLAILRPNLNRSQWRHLHTSVYKLVHSGARGRRGLTVLHIACTSNAAVINRFPSCKLPNYALVEMLLHVGADPNATDFEGDTPLHLTAMMSPSHVGIVKLLLDNGAHIDAVNNFDLTFENILEKCGRPLHSVVNPLPYTRLTCLAARVIQKYQLPYRGNVPKDLEIFIKNHGLHSSDCPAAGLKICPIQFYTAEKETDIY